MMLLRSTCTKLSIVPVRLIRPLYLRLPAQAIHLEHCIPSASQTLSLLHLTRFCTSTGEASEETRGVFQSTSQSEETRGVSGSMNQSEEGGAHSLTPASLSSPQLCNTSPVAHDVASPIAHDTLPVAHDTSGDTSPVAEDKSADDKFTYFSKGYTSEVFKIRLSNIPGRMGYNVSTKGSAWSITSGTLLRTG